MLKIGDYKIVYSKEANEVIIGLPTVQIQTVIDKTRKEEVSNEELALILMSAMAVLEKGKKENEKDKIL